jgi:hypothetical protein
MTNRFLVFYGSWYEARQFGWGCFLDAFDTFDQAWEKALSMPYGGLNDVVEIVDLQSLSVVAQGCAIGCEAGPVFELSTETGFEVDQHYIMSVAEHDAKIAKNS